MSDNAKTDEGGAHDDGGAVGRFLHKLFGRSWKTTLLGAVAVGLAVVPLVPGISPELVALAQKVGPIVLGGGVLLSKDFNASHTKP